MRKIQQLLVKAEREKDKVKQLSMLKHVQDEIDKLLRELGKKL